MQHQYYSMIFNLHSDPLSNDPLSKHKATEAGAHLSFYYAVIPDESIQIIIIKMQSC